MLPGPLEGKTLSSHSRILISFAAFATFTFYQRTLALNALALVVRLVHPTDLKVPAGSGTFPYNFFI